MQYYIKIFNANTDELVGYYKETGVGCVSKMLKGIKYFDCMEDALKVFKSLDDGFLRDKDGHYYKCAVSIYGNHERFSLKQNKKEVDPQDELNAFIRQNSGKNR